MSTVTFLAYESELGKLLATHSGPRHGSRQGLLSAPSRRAVNQGSERWERPAGRGRGPSSVRLPRPNSSPLRKGNGGTGKEEGVGMGLSMRPPSQDGYRVREEWLQRAFVLA